MEGMTPASLVSLLKYAKKATAQAGGARADGIENMTAEYAA
jgi:hypothetical protein